MEGRRKERREETEGGTLAKRVLITTSPTPSIDLQTRQLANVMCTHLDQYKKDCCLLWELHRKPNRQVSLLV